MEEVLCTGPPPALLPPLLRLAIRFMTAYACPFAPSFACRVLDVMVTERSSAMLIRTGLAILMELEPEVLELNDFEQIIEHLKARGTASGSRLTGMRMLLCTAPILLLRGLCYAAAGRACPCPALLSSAADNSSCWVLPQVQPLSWDQETSRKVLNNAVGIPLTDKDLERIDR